MENNHIVNNLHDAVQKMVEIRNNDMNELNLELNNIKDKINEILNKVNILIIERECHKVELKSFDKRLNSLEEEMEDYSYKFSITTESYERSSDYFLKEIDDICKSIIELKDRYNEIK